MKMHKIFVLCLALAPTNNIFGASAPLDAEVADWEALCDDDALSDALDARFASLAVLPNPETSTSDSDEDASPLWEFGSSFSAGSECSSKSEWMSAELKKFRIIRRKMKRSLGNCSCYPHHILRQVEEDREFIGSVPRVKELLKKLVRTSPQDSRLLANKQRALLKALDSIPDAP
ncbi:hypothetical protein EBZ39_14015 [bacterium]|nr:hypothetical protein [bacterium]